ncbi:MAG: hypothetical protein AB1611_19030 [bacterium]
MPGKNKLSITLLVLGVCTITILGWMWCSSYRTEKGEEMDGTLLDNEETALLLDKIDGLLNDSSKKKNSDMHEASEILHPEVHHEDEKVEPPKNQIAAHDLEDKNKKSVSWWENNQQNYRTYPDMQGNGQPGNPTIAQGQTKHKSEKIYGSGYGSGSLISLASKEKTLPSSYGKPLAESSTTNNGGNPIPWLRPPVTPPEDTPISPEPEDNIPDPEANPWSVDFWGHITNPPNEGAWVVAYNTEGKVCGKTRVKKDGTYGILHVYMDDAGTPEKEGMQLGEPIIFQVGGKRAEPVIPGKAVCQGDGLNQLDLKVES